MANYNLLQAIQPPQVVGQLPQVDPNQSMNTFSNGLMSGILQGQQMQSNGMTLQKQKQDIADQQALRNAKTDDQWLQTLQSQGKFDDALKYKTYQLQYQNQLLQNKTSVIDLNDKERHKADRDNTINVAVMGQVSQEKDPIKQQELYQKYYTDLKKQYPDLVMPTKFNADSFASVMRTNQVIQATQVKAATDSVATLTQLENRLDNLIATKAQYEKNGTPTARINEQIQNTQNLIKKNTETANTTSASDVEKKTEYLTKLKQDVDAAKTPEEKAQAQDKLETAIGLAKQDKGMWEQIKDKVISWIPGGAPARKASSPVQSTPQFQEGQIYKDANGNQAKYVGGKWVEIK